MNMIEKTRAECISCKKCTKHCPFLQKYGMDLKDFTFRPDLRKSCFMCGVCTQVCPLHLAGEKIALELRRQYHAVPSQGISKITIRSAAPQD